MRTWLKSLFPTRPGEGLVTTLMFLYICGVLTFYYILKPLKDGLFLANYPSADLPYPNFLTALFAGTLATLVFRLGRRVSAITLLTGTNLLITGTLFCFFWAGSEARFLPYVFYVYVQIVSVLSTAQFWLLAGYVYDNQQAKRLYGLLGAGAIIGAMAGSMVSGLLMRELRLGTGTMLLICIGICLSLVVISQAVWRFRRETTKIEKAATEREQGSFRELTGMVFGSRHIIYMVALIFTTLIASQLADWQVKDALYNQFKTLTPAARKAHITEFLANLYLATNVLGVLLQVLATNFVVRRFGITAATMLLPAAVFSASWGVLLAPGLWSAVLTDGSDAVFRYSVARSGIELLYLPLPTGIRKRLKFFIDVFIDRFGRFVAALVILAVTLSFYPSEMRARLTAAVAITLSGAAIVVCLRLRRTYAEAFRQQLTRREIDVDEMKRFVGDPATVRLLVVALDGPQERQILYALRLLQSARGIDFSGQLLPLLNHPSEHVRAEAVRTLPALPARRLEAAEPLLQDPAPNVRVAAIEYLCMASAAPAARLQQFLAHSDLGVRLAAAHWAADHDVPGFSVPEALVGSLLSLEGPQRGEARRAAARLARRLAPPESTRILRELLSDPDPRVIAAAARAAGESALQDLLFDIVGMLSDRRHRRAALEALVAYGARITGTLGDVLSDAAREISLRREIPWVLARIPTERSADLLVDNLDAEDPQLKYRVVKALNRLHEQHPELPRPRPVIASHIQAQTRAYYEALVHWQAFQPAEGKNGSRLLVRALKERLDQNLELIFRLLGLQYPQKDIYFAYSALRGTRPDRRGAAIEFLDTLLQGDMKALILPLVEEHSTERLIERAIATFGIESRSTDEVLRVILEQSDTWLKACALHEVGERRIVGLRELVERLAGDHEPIVRETAEWALARVS